MATPSLTSVSPTSYPADNNNHLMRLFGSNFLSTDTLTFTDPQGNSIPSTASKLTFVNSGEIDYQVNDQSDAGNWSVRVNSPDGALHSGSNSFTVAAAALTPSLTSVSPTSYPADNNNHSMQLFGSNFLSTDTLTFTDPQGNSIPSTASKLTFVNSGEIDYQINDQSDAGNWSVRVNSPDGALHSGSNSFTVATMAVTPSLTSVSPTSFPADANLHTMQLFGSNFQSGDTLTFTFPDGTTHPNVRAINFINSNEIDYQFDDGSSAGNWSVRVNSPDGTLHSGFDPFTVAAAALTPSLTSVSPTSFPADANLHTMQLFGSNFQSGDTLTFTFPDGTTHPNVRAINFINSNEIDYQFDDGSSAGNWSVRVNSPDGTLHSGFDPFTVAAAALTPSLTSVSPTSFPADANLHTMQLFGSNFQSGDTLTFTFPDGTTHPNVRAINFINSNEIDYQFDDGSSAGNWSVRVNSPDGTLHSGFDPFTVAAAATTYLISPAPATVNENQGTLNFTITRNNNSASQTVDISTVQDQGYSNAATGTSSTNYYYDGLSNAAYVFSPGQSSIQVPITIHDHGLTSGSEKFSLDVQSTSGSNLASTTFTILNNDAASYWISPGNATVNEKGGGNVTFTVTRSNFTQAETDYVSTVQNWQGSGVHNNNPLTGAGNYFYNGIDTQPLLHFNAGDRTASVTLTTNDPGLTSGSETFGFIVQQTPTSATVASTSFTILNNDTAATSPSHPITAPVPTLQEYIHAADWVYPNRLLSPDNDPSTLLQFNGLTPLSVTDSFDLTGFHAQAFQDGFGNIIIAYEGTRTDPIISGLPLSPLDVYSNGSLLTDLGIAQGHFQPVLAANAADLGGPAAAAAALAASGGAALSLAITMNKAVAFATAVHNQFSSSPIYVTGHSLGGAEAEEAAYSLSFVLGGDTFGAPGVPGYYGTTSKDFTNYIDYGDPIGNYAHDSMSALHAFALTGNHFGTVDLVGNRNDAIDLTGLSLSDYTTDVSKLSALFGLGHHFRTQYWPDLGDPVTASQSDSSFFSDIISKIAQVAQLPGVGQVLTGIPGAELLSAGLGNNFFVGDGSTTVSYAGSPNGVFVDAIHGLASNGYGGTDTFSNILSIVGSRHDDTTVSDSGFNLTGGGGADTFLFGAAAFADGQAGVIDRVTDLGQGNSGSFQAAEGDQIDLSALLSTAYNLGNGQPVSSLVRAIASGGGTDLQIDPDGAANGTNWVTVAHLDGIHHGESLNVILDASQPAGAAIAVAGAASNGSLGDILWQNDNGSVAIWNNGQAAGGHVVANPGSVQSSWHIAGSGDFDGNSHSDLLWQNDNGSVAIWDDSQAAGGHVIANAGSVQSSWHIATTGDFDGNGHTDILWQNDNGAVAIWDNGQAASGHVVANAGSVPGSWHIAGTGDFDGNHQSDILWQNDNGSLAIWDNGQPAGGHVVANVGQVPDGWHIAATGDFDGNGHTDILWQNDNGSVAIWDNGQPMGGHVVANAGQVPSSWHIAATGDFDRNGHTDILWQNDNGGVAIWDNGQPAGGHVVANAGGVASDWHFV
jgi:uncharacterized protein YxjI